jgi:hypothetical protein
MCVTFSLAKKRMFNFRTVFCDLDVSSGLSPQFLFFTTFINFTRFSIWKKTSYMCYVCVYVVCMCEGLHLMCVMAFADWFFVCYFHFQLRRCKSVRIIDCLAQSAHHPSAHHITHTRTPSLSPIFTNVSCSN